MADMTLGVVITADASEVEQEAAKAEQAITGIEQESAGAAQRIAASFSNAFSGLGSGLQNGLSSAGQMLTNTGKKFESAGAQMTSSGKAMSMGITAPLTAIYKASDAAFKEVDAGMDIVVKKTGATGDALEGLQDVMKNVATSIPTDFETAGSAVGEVNTRFGLTGDALEELSGKFVKFGQLNETDVSNAVDKTQQILSAFGLTADDAGGMLDTLNEVSQRTGVSVDELMASAQANATAFKDLGFGAADTINFLGQLDVSGADSSAVLAGLKKAMQNAAKEGKPMSSAMEEVQSSIKNAKSDTEATQIAMELFGAKAGPAIAQAVREGKLSFDELGASLTDAAGNIDTTFENTQDGADKLTPSMNRLKASTGELSNQVNGQLAPHMERLAGIVERLSKWFSELDPNTQQLIVTIGLVAAVIGPLLLILGSMSTAIGGLLGANGLGGLLTLLGGLSAPILVVIGVVTALVAVFATLWTTNEEFRNSITTTFGELMTIFSEFFTQLFNQFAEWGLTTENLKIAWEQFCNFLAPIITVAFEVIKEVIRFGLNFILGLIKIFHGLFTGNWDEVWQGAKQILSAAVTLLKNLFGDMVSKLVEKALELKDKVVEKFNELKERVKEKIESLKEAAKEKFFDMVGVVVDEIREFVHNIKEKFEELKQGVSEKIDGVKQTIEDGFNAAIDFITGLASDAFSWGSDIIDGIVDGIWSGIGAIADAASSVADTIWSYLHFSVPEKGPLTDFHDWMPDFIGGLAKDMQSQLPTLRAGVDLIANEMGGIVPGTGNSYGYDGGHGGGSGFGNVYITVNGAPGQDETEIADRVMDRIMNLVIPEV